MKINFKKQHFISAKGQIFTIDGLFALVFCVLFLIIFTIDTQSNKKTNIELLKLQKINDLLITAQYLNIQEINALEKNYLILFPNTCGYVKINNNVKEINCTNSIKKTLLSNSIKYINNSNHKIYIEIGVY